MCGFNNFPTMLRTVGELASDLLKGLIGGSEEGDWLEKQLGRVPTKASVSNWWKAAQKIGEEAYVCAHIFPAESGAQEPVPAHVTIIAHRYPQHLPTLYRKLLAERSKLSSHSLVKGIAESALPREVKIELLLEGAAHPDLACQFPALGQLQELEADESDEILLKILASLPSTTGKPVWLCREGRVAIYVGRSRSVAVWQAFTAFAKGAHVSLRLQVMQGFPASSETEQDRSHQIHFLSQFLDDPEVRSIESDRKLYEGPCAAFTFPRITVGDFAAMQLALFLKWGIEPHKEWTEEEWRALRERVRSAVRG
jgi:hypothetical protein